MARFAATYAPLAILALLWELVSRSGVVSQYALPPLSTILAAWGDLLADPDYYRNIVASVLRGLAGLSAALVLGIALGTSMATWRSVNLTIGPIVQLFYPLPKSALIPLTIIWFGIGDSSKVFLIFLGCFLPISTATFNGVRGVERTLIWSAASLGANGWARLRDVAVMAAIPDILAGVRTALALTFVLLVSSELLISNEGIGFLIRIYGDGSQYPKMFACTFTVMLLGFLADRCFRRLSGHLLRWRT
ncbi:ABC transporter permease [Bosea sp. BH3]|uniref:ABC transporter permease n=1 Tax=Bosea sp. BH3 TaxID=2871701 RepID=UPI0021CB424C|nr:ABC transporter permease [Bosea sp. BH3]MCU4178345.1 ABC transporter permease [Bosea sp. BH3]